MSSQIAPVKVTVQSAFHYKANASAQASESYGDQLEVLNKAIEDIVKKLPDVSAEHTMLLHALDEYLKVFRLRLASVEEEVQFKCVLPTNNLIVKRRQVRNAGLRTLGADNDRRVTRTFPLVPLKRHDCPLTIHILVSWYWGESKPRAISTAAGLLADMRQISDLPATKGHPATSLVHLTPSQWGTGISLGAKLKRGWDGTSMPSFTTDGLALLQVVGREALPVLYVPGGSVKKVATSSSASPSPHLNEYPVMHPERYLEVRGPVNSIVAQDELSGARSVQAFPIWAGFSSDSTRQKEEQKTGKLCTEDGVLVDAISYLELSEVLTADTLIQIGSGQSVRSVSAGDVQYSTIRGTVRDAAGKADGAWRTSGLIKSVETALLSTIHDKY